MSEPRLRTVGHGLYRRVFGDRLGLLVFLGGLAFFFIFWRIDFLLNDTRAMANTLVNVADGRLAVTARPYKPELGPALLPGMVEVDGVAYGRNYGHVFLAVPVLWLLDLLAAVVDPRLLLAGVWSLLLVAIGHLLAVELDRSWLRTAGNAVALVLFAGNVATAVDLPGYWLALVAFQFTTMLAAALTGTLVYRLVSRLESRRVGAAAGVAIVLATPVAFWAPFPKRHALTAAVVAAVLYLFAVSRDPGHRRARLACYALVAGHMLVHPREAVFLLLVLAPLDVLSAPSNDRRTVGLVAGVFLLALVPFLVVNTLISGNPLAPPRVLLDGSLDGQIPEPGSDGGGGGGSGGGGSGGGGSGDGSGSGGGGGGSGGSGGSGDGSGGGSADGGVLPSPLGDAVASLSPLVAEVTRPAVRGLATLGDTGRLSHTFVRSGWIPRVSYRPGMVGTELAFLETFPLAAGLLVALRRLPARLRQGMPGLPSTPAGWTDLFAVAFVVAFGLVNLQRLPLHAQLTPRYLLPLVPAVAYLVARVPAVNTAVAAERRWLVGSYLTTVVAGGGLLALALAALDPARGEAMQVHALVALGAALVAVAALSTQSLHGDRRLGAAALALPAGLTTVFLVFAGVVYFPPSGGDALRQGGTYALGLSRALADLAPLL